MTYFSNLFCVLDYNQLYSLSSTNLLSWDKVRCLLCKINGLPLMLSTRHDEVVYTMNITQPSAPEPEDPMNLYYVVTDKIHPSIALPFISYKRSQRQSSNNTLKNATGIGVVLCRCTSGEKKEDRDTDGKRQICLGDHCTCVNQ